MTNILDEPPQADLDDGLAGAEPSIDPQKIPHPEATRPLKVQWQYAIVLSLVHVVALFAFVGWFFTWLHSWLLAWLLRRLLSRLFRWLIGRL